MVEKLENSEELKLFIKKIKNRDKGLYIHSHNVAIITEYLLNYLGYDERMKAEIITGALIHDLGKLCVDMSILKKEGKLDFKEREEIKCHPKMGFDFINELGFTEIVSDIILHHHENEVGTGYPSHMTSLEKETVIVSLADKYEAIFSKRPYKESHTHEETIAIMQKEAKSYTDCAKIMEALKNFDPSILLDPEKQEIMVAI